MLALLTGCAIGLVRGGRLRALSTVRLHSPGWLVSGIAAVLVVSWIGPGRPLLWMLGAYVAFGRFGLRNLHLTGIIVALIGMLMNVAPLIANGAVPVSERALVSVGQVTSDGQPLIDGIRESNETASSFAIFGDIVPVPMFDRVVSLGDLVILIALVDIVMNVLLLARSRELDEAGVTFAADDAGVASHAEEVIDLREPTPERPRILSPTSLRLRDRPAHAARHRRPRFNRLHTIHVPAHVAPKHSTQPTPAPPATPEAPGDPTVSAPLPAKSDLDVVLDHDSVIVLADESDGGAYVEHRRTGIDSRPIIDLTTSPTDEQLSEFFRRRTEADRELLEHHGRNIEAHAKRRPRRRIHRPSKEHTNA